MVQEQQKENVFEIVKLTDKFHSYRVGHGPQYNPGELVRVPASEADVLVAAGAAVRHVGIGQEGTDDEKALAHPQKDKMIKDAAKK